MQQNTIVPASFPSPRGWADLVLLLFSMLFVLGLALIGQLLFLRWREWFPGAESETSLFKSVRAGVYTFMSHLT